MFIVVCAYCSGIFVVSVCIGLVFKFLICIDWLQGGKKRSSFYYDLWNIKYLSKFKWDDLTEELGKCFMISVLFLLVKHKQIMLKQCISYSLKESYSGAKAGCRTFCCQEREGFLSFQSWSITCFECYRGATKEGMPITKG